MENLNKILNLRSYILCCTFYSTIFIFCQDLSYLQNNNFFILNTFSHKEKHTEPYINFIFENYSEKDSLVIIYGNDLFSDLYKKYKISFPENMIENLSSLERGNVKIYGYSLSSFFVNLYKKTSINNYNRTDSLIYKAYSTNLNGLIIGYNSVKVKNDSIFNEIISNISKDFSLNEFQSKLLFYQLLPYTKEEDLFFDLLEIAKKQNKKMIYCRYHEDVYTDLRKIVEQKTNEVKFINFLPRNLHYKSPSCRNTRNDIDADYTYCILDNNKLPKEIKIIRPIKLKREQIINDVNIFLYMTDYYMSAIDYWPQKKSKLP